MFRKANTKILFIVFAVLLALVVVRVISKKKKGVRSFRSEIVTLDTAKVRSIQIISNAIGAKSTLVLEKQKAQWQLNVEDKGYSAEPTAISGILQTLSDMKTERLVARSKEKWGQYELDDSLAIHVIVKEGNKEKAHFVVGKFDYQQPANQYQQQGKMTSYVRVEGEDEVYAVDGFLRMVFNPDMNSFRNKTLIKCDKNNVNKLVFNTPEGNYTLQKQESQWMVSGLLADSVKVDEYLSKLAFMSSPDFADEYSEESAPSYSLRVEGDNIPKPITINVYNKDTTKVLSSSQNPDAYFLGNGNSMLFDKIFIGQSEFVVKD